MNPSTGTAMFAPDPRRGRAQRARTAPKTAAKGHAWYEKLEAWLRRGRRERHGG